jgi:hypothetical protein
MNDNTKFGDNPYTWYLHEATGNYFAEVGGVIFTAPVNIDDTPDFDSIGESEDQNQAEVYFLEARLINKEWTGNKS